MTDIKEAPLGETFTFRHLRNQCQAVWGGVAWPSNKRAGFAVVLGMLHEPHFDSYDVYLLDEFESFDIRELVRRCGALDEKYFISATKSYIADASECWIGDFRHDAASRFIKEMNETTAKFSLRPTMIAEMENVYGFILPLLKDMCKPERRQLFLRDSRILNYLGEVEAAEIADLKLGEFPAIEALAFTVIEIRKSAARRFMMARTPSVDPHSYDEPFLEWGKKRFSNR